jgi:hypothetical protein
MLTESQVDALELEKVQTKITKVFERDDKFYASINKAADVEVISNRLMRVPLELRTGGNFGYFNPDGGDLGRGGAPQFDKATLNSVFMRHAIEYTKKAQWATDSNRKAVTSGVKRITASALDELRRQLDAQMMGSGNGVLGTVTTDTPASGENVVTMTTDGFGANLVRFGQTVQVYNSTLATKRGEGEITFWDKENKTININPQIAGVTGTDLIVVDGIAAPATLPGLYGVRYHHSNASTGTWLGFSRSTTPEVRSNRVNGASSALSLPLPRLALNKVGNRVGIDESMKVTAWMHPAQKAAYEEIGQLITTIHKKPSDEPLNLYFSDNMQLAGAPVRCSYQWDKTVIDFVVDSMWGRAEMLPVGFYTTDGRRLFEVRGASGGVATAELFYLVCGMQFFVRNPAGTAYIDSLAVPAGY